MTYPISKNIYSKFGFVILCPERNYGGLKNTISSIKNSFPQSPYLNVVGNDAQDEEFSEMCDLCKTIKAGNTITSLINCGIKQSQSEWCVLVFAGSWIRSSLLSKSNMFISSYKDVLFPVVDRKINFIDGSMNGIILNKKFFKEVGDFSVAHMQKTGMSDIELAKTFWSNDAIDQGAKFKAIVGMRVC